MKAFKIVFRVTFYLFLMVVSAFFFSNRVMAGPALISFQDYTQPSGQHLTATLVGDEWNHWVVTDKDEVIIQGSDSYWYYTKIVNGALVPADAKYAIDSPPAVVVTRNDVMNQVDMKPNENSLPAPIEQPQLEQKSMLFNSLNFQNLGAPSFSTPSSSSPLVTPHNLSSPHKLLVLLVNFSNTTIVNSDSAWNSEIFGTGNSVNSYYKEVSNNKFWFLPATETSGTANDGIVDVTLNYPHPNSGGSTGSANQKIVSDALTAANASVDFAIYDTNNDGYLSTDELHVVTIVAGHETSYDGSTPSVWGHHWSLFGSVPPVVLDTKTIGEYSKLGGYVQIGEMQGSHMATIGILCHELGHDLGLPDLYDTSNISSGLGIHSIMAAGSWGFTSGNYQGNTPTHFDAWSKMYLGFATVTEASQTGSNTIKSDTGDVYRVSTSNPLDYFLVENREISGYDAGLANYNPHGGIAIFHIDESVISAKFSSNTVNNTIAHKGIKIEEANQGLIGHSQLDSKDNAIQNDYYYVGSAANTAFTPLTIPNSNLYSGGSSGLSITATSVAGTSMTFDVQAATVPKSTGNAITFVAVSKKELDFKKGGPAVTLTATITPTTAADKSLTWSSSDTSVATVSSKGAVTPVGVGSATITVTTASGGLTDTASITVTIPVASVSLDQSIVNFKVGDADKTLVATVLPTDATNKTVVWSSSNPSSVTVDTYGTIHAAAPGKATITALTQNGLKKTTSAVTVPVVSTNVLITPDVLTLNMGQKPVSLKGVLYPTTTTAKTLTWSSDDATIASVDSAKGTVTPVAVGDTFIKVTTTDSVYKKIAVKVVRLVTGITLDRTVVAATYGDADTTLVATIAPSDATTPDVVWLSSKPSIVTVDSTGKLHFVNAGASVITAKTVDGNKTLTSKVTVNGINIGPDEIYVISTKSATLKATYINTGSVKTVTWSSSDPTIASVNTTTGVVTPLLAGVTTITATTPTGGFVDTANLHVVSAVVTGVTLSPKTATLKIGDSDLSLTPTVSPAGATDAVTWSSSMPTVAAVDVNGVVHALAAGKTTITVTTSDGAKTAASVITVPVKVSSVQLTRPDSNIAKIGTTVKLKATILPTTANQNVTWSSSDETVATVVAGVVTPKLAGRADITVTTVEGSFTDQFTIDVIKSVTGLTLNQAKATLIVGESDLSLVATVAPSDATNTLVTWVSSNPAAATVDTNGVVHAVGLGSAIITATTSDGLKSAKCTITVPRSVKSVKLQTPDKFSMNINTAQTLKYVILPLAPSNAKVSFKSSDETVASVSATGAVKSLKIGAADITVTTLDGTFTDVVTINVIKAVTSVTLSKTSLSVKAGAADVVLTAKVLPADATDTSVTWESSNTNVATVDSSGIVHIVAVGTATIKASSGDGGKTAKCTVTVK
jgi:M6 family metalloprotease-like protein